MKKFLERIDWKSRLGNKQFIFGMISAVLLLLSQILKMFGIEFDFTIWELQLHSIIDTIFIILMLLGIVADPTTETLFDIDKNGNKSEPIIK